MLVFGGKKHKINGVNVAPPPDSDSDDSDPYAFYKNSDKPQPRRKSNKPKRKEKKRQKPENVIPQAYEEEYRNYGGHGDFGDGDYGEPDDIEIQRKKKRKRKKRKASRNRDFDGNRDGREENRIEMKMDIVEEDIDIPAYMIEEDRAARDAAAKRHRRKQKNENEEGDDYANVGFGSILLFFLQMGTFVWIAVKSNYVFSDTFSNPMYGPIPEVMINYGATLDSYSFQVMGRYYMTALYMLHHSGFGHLLLDCLLQFQYCRSIELGFGTLKMLVIWIFGGLTGSCASALLMQGQVAVGASNTTAACLGAHIVDLAFNSKTYVQGAKSKWVWAMIGLFVLAIITQLPLIDGAGIAFGLLSGILWGFGLLLTSKMRQEQMLDPENEHFYQLAQSGFRQTCSSLMTIVAMITFGLVAALSYLQMDVSLVSEYAQSYLNCTPHGDLWTCDLYCSVYDTDGITTIEELCYQAIQDQVEIVS